MEKVRELRTKFTKSAAKKKNVIEKQAFLDDLVNEAIEDPYQFPNIEEAIAHLSQKYKLSVDELAYVKKAAKAKQTNFVKKFRS